MPTTHYLFDTNYFFLVSEWKRVFKMWSNFHHQNTHVIFGFDELLNSSKVFANNFGYVENIQQLNVGCDWFAMYVHADEYIQQESERERISLLCVQYLQWKIPGLHKPCHWLRNFGHGYLHTFCKSNFIYGKIAGWKLTLHS